MATKKAKQKAVELSTQGVANLKALQQTKAKIKELEELKTKLEELIRAELGNAEVGTQNGIEIVSVTKRETKSIALSLIEQKYPSFYKDNVRITPWTFLNIRTSATSREAS